MVATICITICAVFLLVLFVLTKPSVTTTNGHTLSLYWMPPLLGAILLLATGLLPLSTLASGLTATGAVNPLKILTLFLSMTVMSIYLDEVGLFRFVAAKLLSHAGTDQRRLFFLLYLTVSVLTVFTSNDIIILTFTPFLCYFCHHAQIDPLPFLICEFTAANTWSMCLMIGNPTNIYLASAAGIDFLSYVKVMLLPSFLSGTMAFCVLWLLFRHQLATPIHPTATQVQIEDYRLLWIGILHLGICTLLLVVSSYLGFEMWAITLFFALSLFLSVLVYRMWKHPTHTYIPESVRRLPWDLVPFVLSMFALVLALSYHGVLTQLAELLTDLSAVTGEVYSYGLSSLLCANLVNNIPMSVLYSELLSASHGGLGAVYATVIGSNIGAYLTPIGALAGILWSGILRRQGTILSFARFVKYGTAIALPTIAVGLLGLLPIL